MDKVNTPEQSFKSEIQLDVVELRARSRWEGDAQTFLANKDVVDLRPIVDSYTNRLVQLYAWFIRNLIEEVEPLHDEHSELIVEANAARSGLDLDTARALTEEVTRRRSSTEEPASP